MFVHRHLHKKWPSFGFEKKENTFIGLHIQVKQIQELQKNRSKYIRDFTLDTTESAAQMIPVSGYASAALEECRKSAVFMTGPK
jgi:hypothetical protein